MNFENKNILITGASRGIGAAIADNLASRKTNLHLVARKFPPQIKENLLQRGALSVHLWEADLTLMAEVDRLFENLKNKDIDILVNNAGLLSGGLLEEQSPDDIDRMLMVNVHALIRLSRLFLPAMLKRKSGIIVNNASVSGKMFFPCASTYAASKAAVVAFTECLKQELRGTGVSTLLLITPGVKTAMYDEISEFYGGHLDLSFMSSIPTSQWAQDITDALVKGRDTLWPKGSTGFGVFLGHHVPALFERVVRPKFKR